MFPCFIYLFVIYSFQYIYRTDRMNLMGNLLRWKSFSKGRSKNNNEKFQFINHTEMWGRTRKKKKETSTINSFFKLTVSIWKDESETSALYTMLIISFLWIRLCDVSYSFIFHIERNMSTEHLEHQQKKMENMKTYEEKFRCCTAQYNFCFAHENLKSQWKLSLK